MKILLVNTSDQRGGAAIAARRLMESLREAGMDAQLLVINRQSTCRGIIAIGSSWRKRLNFLWERVVIWANNLFSRRNLFTVSIANTGFDITRLAVFREADIIHLHWINQGMLSLGNIEKILHAGKPVVWTMHDLWTCTGICHMPHTCQAFTHECKCCPLLRFPGLNDLAHRTFERKQQIFSQARPHMVAVSQWQAAQARSSALLRTKAISVIPNTLSLEQFPLTDRQAARAALSLPPHDHIILFGAARIDDPIKGFNHLLEALRLLNCREELSPRGNEDNKSKNLHLVLFGAIKSQEQTLAHIPVSYSYMGRIDSTERLALLYAAADVTVSASLYETFGQTLIEAQACGSIPVTFGNSGQADIVRHKENGYIADYLNVKSLADGIGWALTEGAQNLTPQQLRDNVAQRYATSVVAKQYMQLYNEMLTQPDTQHATENIL